jgi:hypothetical protein
MVPVMRALGAVFVVAAVLDGVAAANLRDPWVVSRCCWQ